VKIFIALWVRAVRCSARGGLQFPRAEFFEKFFSNALQTEEFHQYCSSELSFHASHQDQRSIHFNRRYFHTGRLELSDYQCSSNFHKNLHHIILSSLPVWNTKGFAFPRLIPEPIMFCLDVDHQPSGDEEKWFNRYFKNVSLLPALAALSSLHCCKLRIDRSNPPTKGADLAWRPDALFWG
jgi:hypothetical protein